MLETKNKILKYIECDKWPTHDKGIRKYIKTYVESNVQQMLMLTKEQQLEFISKIVFDLRNRIYSIDLVRTKGKSLHYEQAGYSSLVTDDEKLEILKCTKYTNLDKLPPCKTVMVEVPKTCGGNGELGISMPVDNVLQQMVLNYLDVILEQELHPATFGFRKGRDPRMAVAAVYSKLSRIKHLDELIISSLDVNKCFDKILHSSIEECFPFPEKYKYLLKRWLTPWKVNKAFNYKTISRNTRGVTKASIIGPFIVNYMLSNCLPEQKHLLKGIERQRTWVRSEFIFYANDIVLCSNKGELHARQLSFFEKRLSKIGLSLNYNKTIHLKYMSMCKKKSFQFLGFEFIIIPRSKLRYSSMLSNCKNLYVPKNEKKGLGIILRPQKEKFRIIKDIVKFCIKLLHTVNRQNIFKIFRLINSKVHAWASYFAFNQGNIYAKKLDQYVYKWLKRVLVKKFRYNGLRRPKWVAYNFMGLGKTNPNRKKWQFQAMQPKLSKKYILNYVYVWMAGDTFKRTSITTFLLDRKVQEKPYYNNEILFKTWFNKLIIVRLKDDLKVKLYKEQKGLCFICQESINELELYRFNTLVNINHIVLKSLSKGMLKKEYEYRLDKILLHVKCRLKYTKDKPFQWADQKEVFINKNISKKKQLLNG